MKLTQKRKNAIKEFESKRPNTNICRVNVTRCVDVEKYNFDLICRIMKEQPDDCGFGSDSYRGCFFYYQTPESEEAFLQRKKDIEQLAKEFEIKFEQFKQEIYQEQAEEDELKAEEMKAEEKEKYSNPEYLEYLRLKKKFEV